MHEKYSQADNSTLARWQWNITVSSNTLECMTVNSAIGYSSSKRKVRWRCTVICGYNNVQCSLVSLNLIVWLGGVLRNSRGCVDAVWLGDEEVDRSLWCIYLIYCPAGHIFRSMDCLFGSESVDKICHYEPWKNVPPSHWPEVSWQDK